MAKISGYKFQRFQCCLNFIWNNTMIISSCMISCRKALSQLCNFLRCLITIFYKSIDQGTFLLARRVVGFYCSFEFTVRFYSILSYTLFLYEVIKEIKIIEWICLLNIFRLICWSVRGEIVENILEKCVWSNGSERLSDGVKEVIFFLFLKEQDGGWKKCLRTMNLKLCVLEGDV